MIRIAHFGDIQINAAGANGERTIEYALALDTAAKSVIEQQVDYVVIAGDIFERFETTDNERKLYADFVHQILSGLPNCHIVVIDGNHDIRKRNLTFFDGAETSVQTNVLAELDAAINNPRYHYNRDAVIYNFDGIAFACWSELAKYDDKLKRCPYAQTSPAQIDALKDRVVMFDVFHGTMPGAKDLGSDYQFEPDDVVLLGHAAMLGHIHQYQQLGKAVYSSSLVQRTFNEGIRYTATETVYDYRNSHGYVLWTINDARQISHQFMPIRQSVLMTTFVMSPEMSIERLKDLFAKHAYDALSIKLVLDKPNVEALAFAYNFIGNVSNWKIKKVTTPRPAESLEINSSEERQHLALNLDSFIEVSTELLKPIIASKYADEVIASRVLNETLRLLTQEAGYHLHPENQSSIRFNKAVIDNFKTIGHAELDLQEVGLQALRGQNGQGKTTCFEAIAFALTGQHNRTFKRNAKNKQLLRLFNDKQPANDTVTVDCHLTIDGKDYRIHVVLHKFMNDGWNNRNWKSFVTKVDKQVQIFEGEQLIVTGDDADNWLLQYFGTYDDFAILHMIDQQTLESLKFMSPEEFTAFILQRLGYSVINKFQYYYQGCKNNELAAKPKPDKRNYAELSQALTAEETSLAQNAKNIEDNSADITAKKATLESHRKKYNDKQSTKANVPAELIADWSTKINGRTLEALQVELAMANQTIADKQKQIADYTEATANYAAQEKAFTGKIAALVAAAKQTIDTRLAALNADVTAKNASLTTANATNAKLAEQRKPINDSIATLALDEVRKQGDIQKLETELQTLNDDMASLKNGYCPTCHQVVSDVSDHRAKKRAAIDVKQTEIDKAKQELAGIQAQMQAKRAELSGIPADIDTAETAKQIASINADIQTMTSKLAKLTTTDYQLQLLQANDAESYAAYQLLKESKPAIVDTVALQAEIAEKQTDITKLNDAILAHKQLQQYAALLDKNAEIDKELAAIQGDIDTAQEELSSAQSTSTTLALEKQKIEGNIATLKDLMAKTVEYDIVIDALAHYKWLVFEALPTYLYKQSCHIVNDYIEAQHLPDTIQVRLSETESGQLLLLDRMNDSQVVARPILEASGMEITIAGLVVCLALHAANLTIDFPFVMLDELTGKLNTGNEKDDTNYLDVMLQVLQSSAKHCQLLMIDHRYSNDAFDKITTISKDKATNISYT